MRNPTPADWADYLHRVTTDQALVDQLWPDFKAVVWEEGFNALKVRQMLAYQRRNGQVAKRKPAGAGTPAG
jgi:hypothetical protein